MVIMIIGSESEFHAQHIYNALQARGRDCFYLDTRCFPETLMLNLTPCSTTLEQGYLTTPEGKRVPIADIRTVFWRYHHGINLATDIPQEVATIVYRELESAIGSFFRNMPHIHWVNPPSAIERHRYKAHQLYLMANAGMPVPDTLISNDPEAVRQFYEKWHGQVIYKPVAGGAHTTKLLAEDLRDERLEELKKSPVQFQQMIEGVDIRIYLIGDEIFAAEIQAGSLDFRDDPHAPIVRVDVPEAIQAHCKTLARMFEYKYTGIDVRRTPDGEYFFIEGNPAPMFVHFEKVTGFPITQKLVELLEQTAGLPT